MINPFQRLYDWTLRMAAHKQAAWWLAGIAFLQSSIFPIPPDAALMPMCVAHRQKSFQYALICTLGSVAGGIFGYGIGYFLFESVGKNILTFYGLNKEFTDFQEKFNDWGGWIVFISACIPIPYKVITIASGLTKLDMTLFITASVIGRGLRFFLVAGLLWKYGRPIQTFVEKYLNIMMVFFFVLLISGFVSLKYLL